LNPNANEFRSRFRDTPPPDGSCAAGELDVETAAHTDYRMLFCLVHYFDTVG